MPNEKQEKVLTFIARPGSAPSRITQAMLQEHLELASAYKIAKRRYEESRSRLIEAVRVGTPVEAGFLVAELRSTQREELIVGC